MIGKHTVFATAFSEKLLCFQHFRKGFVCRAVICFDIFALLGFIAVFDIFHYTLNTAITSVDDVTVSDDFAPAIDLTSVIFNGNAWVLTTDYTYDETTGEFATVPGRIPVPAATYSQNPTTGVWTVTPGVSTLVITGTI